VLCGFLLDYFGYNSSAFDYAISRVVALRARAKPLKIVILSGAKNRRMRVTHRIIKAQQTGLFA
jgi:hypothetical protein